MSWLGAAELRQARSRLVKPHETSGYATPRPHPLAGECRRGAVACSHHGDEHPFWYARLVRLAMRVSNRLRACRAFDASGQLIRQA